MKRDYTTKKDWLAKLKAIQTAHPDKSLKEIWLDMYADYGGRDGAAQALGITPAQFSAQAKAMGLEVVVIRSLMDATDWPVPVVVTEKGRELVAAMRAMHDSDKVGV